MPPSLPSSAPGSSSRLSRFLDFFRTEASGGMLLLACAVAALIWANSPFGASYFALWDTLVTVGVGGFVLSKPLLLWINDGLMAVFFFLIGLEIKREVLAGELRNPRGAAFALVAAIGGMAVPALLYTAFNAGLPTMPGWGIPMATDIAFALGVLALLGSRVPVVLKIFLTALAIVDDLGAVIVIALFYTAELSVPALLVAGGFLAVLVIVNRLGVQHTLVYVLLGIGLWLAVLQSGVHATVAGVALALTIPAVRRVDGPSFMETAQGALATFSAHVRPGNRLLTPEQSDAVHTLEEVVKGTDTPLTRLEHALHGPVAFFIIPVFALANAGVALGGDFGAMVSSPVALGIIVGLVIGKAAGVFGFAWLAVKTGIAGMPRGATWAQIFGVSALCGIGFTMSIFIATLAFPGQPELIDTAKLGIVIGSLASGILGWILLTRSLPAVAAPPPADPVLEGVREAEA